MPILSYNYALRLYGRVRHTVWYSTCITAAFMLLGTLCFELFPTQLLGLFSQSAKVAQIGRIAFRIIRLSFVPATYSLMMPMFFQTIGKGMPSMMLALSRQIFCLIPLFYLLSLIGLNYTWLAFPLAETITGGVGIILYCRQLRLWENEPAVLKPLS